MKWIFSFLVLANLGLWMWASWYMAPADPVSHQARPAVAPEKMKLFSEPGAVPKARAAKAANKELTNNNPGAQTPAPQCFRLGPFEQQEALAAAAENLKSMKVAYVSRSEEQNTSSGYRVFLPSQGSKDAAERKRRELTKLGFKDHALINEPELQNAISLGLFSVESNARAHLKKLSAKGVKGQIAALDQSKTLHWLDLTISPSGAEGAPQDVVETLKKQDWKAPSVILTSQACATKADAR